jgi:V8-like Glu-specific endopeptidase
LLVQLNEMNRIHNLRSGDVPLAQWLRAAITLAGDMEEADVFEDALDRVMQVPARTPAPGPAVFRSPVAAPTLADANLDVQPEAMMAGSDQTVHVGFLKSGLIAARSVVKLLVHRHEDGAGVYQAGDQPWLVNGTGWFIGPGLVITNHHVINARMTYPVKEPDASELDFRVQAESTMILYDYLKEDSPSYKVKTSAGALQAAAGDRELDYAILRVPDGAQRRDPLRLRRHRIRKRLDQPLGTRVNVLQHPNGEPMRLGFRDNFVVLGDDKGLSYLTDTDLGSSGSPVCDDQWSVAALHSGSRSISADDITIRGRKVRRENHGISIRHILDHLRAEHPGLFEEITAG